IARTSEGALPPEALGLIVLWRLPKRRVAMHSVWTEQEHRPGRQRTAAEFHRDRGGASRDPRWWIEPQGFRNNEPRVREGVQVGSHAQVLPPRLVYFLLHAICDRRMLIEQQPGPHQGRGHRRMPRDPEREDLVPHLRGEHRLAGGPMPHRGEPGHQVGWALSL